MAATPETTPQPPAARQDAGAAFVSWLDPASLAAIVDDRPDAYDWLRSRAAPDPATGGSVGISIMVVVVAFVAAMLACGATL